MEYAVIDAGQIVGYRTIDDWNSYPEHKRTARDEKGDGGPTLRPVVVEGSGPTESVVIEAAQVKRVRSDMSLADLKRELKACVSSAAEMCRLRYITPGSGKAMAYLEKHNQAEAVIDLGQAEANALTEQERKEQFPTLSASVGIEAATLWECAQIVRARYEAWATISHDIELAELQGKKNISDASDAAAARAAYEAITWPNP